MAMSWRALQGLLMFSSYPQTLFKGYSHLLCKQQELSCFNFCGNQIQLKETIITLKEF